MIIKEFEYILKDGRRAIIRSPKEEDIDSMLDYLYKSASETDFVLRYPEECSIYTKEKEKELSGNLEDLYESLYKVEIPEELKGRKNKSQLKKAIASIKVQEDLDKNNEEVKVIKTQNELMNKEIINYNKRIEDFIIANQISFKLNFYMFFV